MAVIQFLVPASFPEVLLAPLIPDFISRQTFSMGFKSGEFEEVHFLKVFNILEN